jgi:membrane protein DedA with SNARE-associated domain
VLTTRGPLQRGRRKALARGEEVFGRHPVIAIVLTPTWIAGIHGVRARIYLPTNAAAAGAWAVGIGLGAYFVGPTVVDVVDDLGLITGIGLVLLILAAVATEITRRRRRSAADDEPTAAGQSKKGS